MKKLLSIATAVLMLFVLSTSVFAAEETAPSVTPDPVTMTKEYTLTGGDTTPAEVLEFEVTLESGVEGGVSELPVIETDNTVTVTSSTTTSISFTVTLPTYTKVGVYTYKIVEKEGSTLGVGYDEDEVYMVVTVTNSSTDSTSDAFTATVAFHKGSLDGEKNGKFTNTYGLGQLTVTKNVSGNLASNTKKFTIHVTFSGGANAGSGITYSVAGGDEQTLAFGEGGTATLDVELSNGQSVVFTNIPAGVTYTVVEDEKHTEGADSPETTEEGYTVSYTNSDDELKIDAGDTDTVTVLNEKKTDIDTGISLDSLPYITLLVGVMVLAAFMVIRRRRANED